jgi:NAD(P)-dependent dehydrogenase (short-subunit alcohol dehydrogenase family)
MPDMELKGKVAIVTGAGSRGEGIGNGRASAILLAREGVHVALIDTDCDALQDTARLIKREGGSCVGIETDVTNPQHCERAVALTVDRWARLDILVNNVGLAGPPGCAVDVDLEAWDRGLRVNVTSMMLMSKYAIPYMREQDAGAIVNIASVAGLRGGHPDLLYATSKGAIVQMTRAMAANHGPEGIRVNCIAPGMVYTPMVSARGMTHELRDKRRKRSLLQTEGNGWDVGNAVVYLASNQSRWVTGIVLPVDAGTTAGQLPG